MRAERTYLEEIDHATQKAGFERNAALFRQSCEVLSEKIAKPTIVKVGANDGITHDPCAATLLNHANWRGVLIEPVPYCFDRLKANYSDPRFILEDIAIGAEAGTRQLYFIRKEAREKFRGLPNWVEMIGSFDRDHVVQHIGKRAVIETAGALDDFIESRIVTVDTLANVIARHSLTNLTLLHIDCEGHDYVVMRSLGTGAPLPMNLYIEHKHLSLADKTALTAGLHRSKMAILDCGSDYFAFNPGRWLGVSTDHYADLMRYAK